MVNLQEMLKEAEGKNVNARYSPCGNYVLFKYSKTISYDGEWNRESLHSRGIVFDVRNGECVAFPYEKFFNLNEHSEELEEKFLREGLGNFSSRWSTERLSSATVLDKLDGSLAIIWLDNEGELRINTPGSFDSEQAIFAKKWIQENGMESSVLSEFSKNGGEYHTILAEFIHPSTTMVVEYSSEYQGLHIHGARKKDFSWASMNELSELSERTGLHCIKVFSGGYEAVSHLRNSNNGKECEGWVIWDEKTNLRVKVKTEDYCLMHRKKSLVHPNRVIEMFTGIMGEKGFQVESEYEILERFFNEAIQWVSEIDEEYRSPYNEFVLDYKSTVSDFFKNVNNFLNENKNLQPKDVALNSELSDFEKHAIFNYLKKGEVSISSISLKAILLETKKLHFALEP